MILETRSVLKIILGINLGARSIWRITLTLNNTQTKKNTIGFLIEEKLP